MIDKHKDLHLNSAFPSRLLLCVDSGNNCVGNDLRRFSNSKRTIPYDIMETSPYAAAAHIPLIKSPSLRVPPPVDLPPDIHPLPESVTPYFVYPFTLEQHILTVESARRSTLASHASRREAYLRSREDEKERRKRDALRRIAPGFEPHGNLLIPTKNSSLTHQTTPSSSTSPNPTTNPNGQTHHRTRSVMDDLVDQLAAMESRDSSSK
ncbi:hypothetical protein CVT24_009621 [Panaeolus cyanescens]|uniref:Uncharacterized protein n=1 Tax=Panaeolus cyanescens TaxID=181874 RepID=A0A409Y9X7_9AGAR|nr:hypothetical protein CVT24_009621 [Panaeolus cyanescens]